MRSTRLSNQTDEELARGARAGSLGCFEELVRRYQVPLMQFLLRQLRSQQDAEDAIQEAFLRAWQSIGNFRDGAAFKPWLFVIAARLAIDALRRRRGSTDAIDDLADQRENGPLIQVQRNESQNILWTLVRRILPAERFQVVWLHYGESMSSNEIAEVTGRSRVWVKTALFRARAKMRAAIAGSRQT
jgi:RNA polymerase sigma-70 factor, ECF subfamily